MASFAEAPAGSVERGAKIFKTKCVRRGLRRERPAARGCRRKGQCADAALCAAPQVRAVPRGGEGRRPPPGAPAAPQPAAQRAPWAATVRAVCATNPRAPHAQPAPSRAASRPCRAVGARAECAPTLLHNLRAPTWAVCSGACRAPRRASPTPRPTRRPPSPGARPRCTTTCSTPRSTSRVRRTTRGASAAGAPRTAACNRLRAAPRAPPAARIAVRRALERDGPVVLPRLHGALWPDTCDLTAPRRDRAGTKMVFAGLKKPEERADLIAYLKSATA